MINKGKRKNNRVSKFITQNKEQKYYTKYKIDTNKIVLSELSEKEFINKVKRMKMQGVTTGIGKLEMDDYINELMRNNLEKERENRIKAFLEHLEDYRFTEKMHKKFRKSFSTKKNNHYRE